MLRPSHSSSRFSAKRIFSGRTDERDVFAQAIAETGTQASYKVLNWHGVGGQGKSALLREFQRMVATFNDAEAKAKSGRQLIPAKVDFEDERLKRVDAALYSLRRQLAQKSGYTFHTFDTAFIAYHSKTRPGADIGTAFPELFKGEKEGMMDLIDVLDDPLTVASHLASAALPGAGLIYKWGARLTGKLAKWWSKRGNEQLTGIEHLQPEQLLERLPIYLGVDLCDNIKAKPDKRPVVLFDTYEALWANRGQKDSLSDRRADAWVRQLVQDAPGTLFVLAGRDALQWGEIDEAWKEVIASYPLGGLSDEDADAYLQAVPIPEEDIRSKIISSSNGLPFYLDLQVSTYEAIREREETLTAGQFGGAPSDILARFLEHLSDADQGTLRLASYLQIITQPVMDALAEAFPGRAVNYSFQRMTARSSFQEISDSTFEIHALMKEELQRREKEENPEQFKKTHQWLFEWFEKCLSDLAGPKHSQDFGDAFSSAFFHLISDDQERAIKWLLKNKAMLESRSLWGIHSNLHLLAINELEKSSKTMGTAIYGAKCSLANAHFQSMEFEEALRLYKEGRKLRGTLNIGSYWAALEAFNIAQTYLELDEKREAKNQLEVALAGFESCETRYIIHISRTNSSLAEISFADGKFSEAVKLYCEAARISTAYPSIQSEALYCLAEALHALGRHGEAAKLAHISLAYEEPELEKVYSRKAVDNHLASEEKDLNLTEITPTTWTDSEELSGYRERRHFDPLSRLFQSFIRGDREPYPNAGKQDTWSNLEMLLRKLLALHPQESDIGYRSHPRACELIERTRQALSLSELGASMLRGLDHYNGKIVILEGKFFDFGCSRQNLTVWVVMPPNSERLDPIQEMALIYALRTLEHDLIGFKSKRFIDGSTEWAATWHAKCLDRIVYIFRYVAGLPEQERYKAQLSEAGLRLFQTYIDDASKEDLFRIYAFDLLEGG